MKRYYLKYVNYATAEIIIDGTFYGYRGDVARRLTRLANIQGKNIDGASFMMWEVPA